LLKAQSEHQFSFADTFLVGDSETDLLAAQAVGCPALLISDGLAEGLEKLPHPPAGIFPTLYAAAQFILRLESDAPRDEVELPKQTDA
jgi:phosphoglycolate phosphatase-like HAD superfamily hydrolase